MERVLQPGTRSEMGSDVEILYDNDDFNLYKIYKKYEELSERLEERLNKIKQKRNGKK